MFRSYGFDKSRFVDLNERHCEEFTCGICLGIVNNPFETQCCRQTFCKQCINEWIRKSKTCPFDRSLLTVNDLIKSSKIVVNLMSKFRIKCDYNEKGCPEVLELGSLQKHSNECKFINKEKLIQQQLVLLLHARKCRLRDMRADMRSDMRADTTHKTDLSLSCPLPLCPTFKSILNHLIVCRSGKTCAVSHCRSSRQILIHWKNCKQTVCPICDPIKRASQIVRKRKLSEETADN